MKCCSVVRLVAAVSWCAVPMPDRTGEENASTVADSSEEDAHAGELLVMVPCGEQREACSMSPDRCRE